MLVGGLYGVDADGSFAGESMFHIKPNASKFALLHLVEHLAARGARWLDIQTLTPHLEILGAREISRDEFLDLLLATRRAGLRLFDHTTARHVEG
jgi:leucyl/phenylalanyl-tRNA--protein transferase